MFGEGSYFCSSQLFFTCVPIPFIKVDPMVYFVLMAISGIFCVIFSVAFAYVSDVTDEVGRSLGYGLVTAGFAASLIISPALGAGLELYTESEDIVVILASCVAIVDVIFIIFWVPESLPSSQKLRIQSLTFKQVDPFSSLRGIWSDRSVLVMSLVSVLSYLPESGQSTCFFVYLTLVLGFSKINVAIFICYVGVISALSQTVVLSSLIKRIGAKKSILIGLTAQFIQLVWYGLSTATWAVWTAGIFVSFSSISYAAISAYLSLDTDKDNQGAVQGTLMAVRGLCNGFGPAAFGLVFYLCGINIIGTLDSNGVKTKATLLNSQSGTYGTFFTEENNVFYDYPGLPFLLASACVVLALVVATFAKDISKGKVDIKETAVAIESNSTESESNSNTKVNMNTSVSNVIEFVETENTKSNIRKC